MNFHKRLFSSCVFYPTHWYNILMSRVFSFRNWWDQVDEGLLLGARPSSKDAKLLSDLGVTGVVNTCDEYAGPVAAYQELGIEQLHIPTIDFTHPKLVDVEAAVDFISKQVDAGGIAYVHCKAGRARSATVAICWLMEYRKMAPEAAQLHLLQVRHQVNPRLLKRPVVQQFIEKRISPNQSSDTASESAAEKT